MPKSNPTNLTNAEITLLNVAACVLEALQYLEENPPPDWSYAGRKLMDNMVRRCDHSFHFYSLTSYVEYNYGHA